MSNESIGDVTIIAIGLNASEAFQLATALSTATNVFENITPAFGGAVTVKSYAPGQDDNVQPATSFTATTDLSVKALQARLQSAVKNSFPAHRDFKMTHDVPPEFEGNIPEARQLTHNATSIWVVCFTN